MQWALCRNSGGPDFDFGHLCVPAPVGVKPCIYKCFVVDSIGNTLQKFKTSWKLSKPLYYCVFSVIDIVLDYMELFVSNEIIGG